MALLDVWRSYTAEERRNIAIYIAGIMFYKLGLEFFNGSITALATDLFQSSNTFTKFGAAQAINQAAQCVGAILIAPLINRWPTGTVLVSAVLLFSLMTTVLLIADAAAGGQARSDVKANRVHWNPTALFAICAFGGIGYAIVKLVRNVIPRGVVGRNVGRPRRIDATVVGYLLVISAALLFFMTTILMMLDAPAGGKIQAQR